MQKVKDQNQRADVPKLRIVQGAEKKRYKAAQLHQINQSQAHPMPSEPHTQKLPTPKILETTQPNLGKAQAVQLHSIYGMTNLVHNVPRPLFNLKDKRCTNLKYSKQPNLQFTIAEQPHNDVSGCITSHALPTPQSKSKSCPAQL